MATVWAIFPNFWAYFLSIFLSPCSHFKGCLTKTAIMITLLYWFIALLFMALLCKALQHSMTFYQFPSFSLVPIIISASFICPVRIWGQCYKTFYARNLQIFVITRVFVAERLFQLSLMFVGKAWGMYHKTYYGRNKFCNIQS